MKWYFWLGLVAAICIAIYMMPQLIKTIRTKDTTSISAAMVILAVVGDLFFIINGIGVLTDSANPNRLSAGLPIFLANLFGFSISAVILFFKIRNMQWAKKFQIKEEQIPAHYKEIKTNLSKERFAKRQAKQAKKQQEVSKKDTPTPVNTGSSETIG